MRQRLALMAFAIILFFLTVSVASTGLRPATYNSISRLGCNTSGLGLAPVAGSTDYRSSILSEASTVALIDYATIYTNLTETVFMVAVDNNSLLNSKNYLWIQAHQNLTDTPLGFLPAGSLTRTRLVIIGAWFNFTTPDGYYFSIRLRQISNAQEIEEIREDIATYQEALAVMQAYSWVVQGVLGGILSAAIIGRWKMSTVEK